MPLVSILENATANCPVANQIGVDLKNLRRKFVKIRRNLQTSSNSREKMEFRVIDDYAHNPAKMYSSIKACQPLAEKVVAWFQPHVIDERFLRKDFVEEISAALHVKMTNLDERKFLRWWNCCERLFLPMI